MTSPHRGCEEPAVEQVRRVQRGVRHLVDSFMQQIQTLEALAGAPEADRHLLAGQMQQARSSLLEEYCRIDRQSSELGRLFAASRPMRGTSDP